MYSLLMIRIFHCNFELAGVSVFFLTHHRGPGGSSQDGCKWCITHGDRKSTKDRVVGPLPNGL